MFALLRLAALLVALLFTVVGLGYWVAPEEAARWFGIDGVAGAGLANLRADLGGLFLGLAVLTAAGAWMKRRPGLIAAAVILGAVILGRAVGALAGGGLGVRELALELAALGVLVALCRRLGRESDADAVARPVKLATAGLAGLCVAAVLAILNPAVQQGIFDQAARRMTARANTAPLADDALRVAIAGSSAPLPSRARAKASVVVFVGGRFWVVDTGPESVENLVLWGIPLSSIAGVLVTHFHSDHIGDLGELQLQTWAGGRPAPLDVYGGPGVEDLVNGFNMAYRLDQGYRTAHHGESVMPSRAWGMIPRTVELDGPPTAARDRTALVYDDGTLRITAIEVDHAPIEPAYAYRFDYKGRSVLVTGDLKNHPPLVAAAKDVDLMVSEAISRSMTASLEEAAHAAGRSNTEAIMHDVQDYHISPEEAAALANRAGVTHLAFYHLLPAPDGFLPRRLFANGVNAVRKGGWTIADDGSLYTLPLGSDDVRVGHIAR
jgi:ribonuclease Z